jgi:peptidoglycan hydrolase-like protein with peptidoglycan-binding domain
VDGEYGPQTQAAVKQFQETHGLVADGWAGDATHVALQLALSKTK